MNLKYWAGALVSLPLLPFLYVQGKRIWRLVPRLPEAKGPEGQASVEDSDLEQVRKGETRPSRREREAVSTVSTVNSVNVLLIGESTFAGVGVATHSEGFAGAFAEELCSCLEVPVRWRVFARSGYVAARIRKKIIPNIIERHKKGELWEDSSRTPSLILIGIGGNDAFSLSRPSVWNSEIRALIDSLREVFPDVRIVFCNMPPVKEFPAFTPLMKFVLGNLVEILGEELGKTVQEYEHVSYLSERITLQGWADRFGLEADRSDFFSDGVHPSKLTYQTWARYAARQVCEAMVH